MNSVIRGRAAAMATGAALFVAAFAVAACGDDESTTTAATSTAATEETSIEPSTDTAASTTTASTGGFADAAAALEADGFAVEEKSDDELVQSAGLPKPITADAGAVVTRSGSSGDLLVLEFATPQDAEAYAKANNDSVLQTEVDGTLAVTATAGNTDLLDQALTAIGG